MIVDSETGNLLQNTSIVQSDSLFQSVISGPNVYLSLPTGHITGSGYELSCVTIESLKSSNKN